VPLRRGALAGGGTALKPERLGAAAARGVEGCQRVFDEVRDRTSPMAVSELQLPGACQREFLQCSG